MEKVFKIYKHTSPSGKVYIGQTSQSNPIIRWKNGGKGYFRINKYGEYQQPAMVNAIKKYPWDEWEHIILDSCTTQEKANELEQFYILKYNSANPNYGYNITKGGHTGQNMSEETKRKLSIAIKEKWKNPEYLEKQKNRKYGSMHPNTKEALLLANINRKCSEETKLKLKQSHAMPVLQYTLDGKFVEEFESMGDAAKKLNVSVSSIANQCSNKTKKCKDYIFILKSQIENIDQILKNKLDKVKSINKRHSKVILQFDKQDNFINEYPSAAEASRQLGISNTSIGNCLKGLSKSAGGFKWKFKQ